MSDAVLNGLFQVVRLQILSMEKSRIPGYGRDNSYQQAWDDSLYPAYHEGVEFHLPFPNHFKVSKETVLELGEFIDAKWMKKEPISFYQLEDHFGRHGEVWHRSMLIDICRYFYLKGMFANIWEQVLEDCPTEARSIISEYTPY